MLIKLLRRGVPFVLSLISCTYLGRQKNHRGSRGGTRRLPQGLYGAARQGHVRTRTRPNGRGQGRNAGTGSMGTRETKLPRKRDVSVK